MRGYIADPVNPFDAIARLDLSPPAAKTEKPAEPKPAVAAPSQDSAKKASAPATPTAASAKTAVVGDVLMPVVGLGLGGVDFSNQFLLLREGAAPGPYASLAAAREAGGVALAYGAMLNTVINFLIVAFALFTVVKAMNTLKRRQEAAPPAPPAPTKEEVLLTEIRDLLARR